MSCPGGLGWICCVTIRIGSDDLRVVSGQGICVIAVTGDGLS